MKAMVLRQPDLAENNPLKLMDLPIPDPRSNEIRLKVKACGVCHTDLHEVEGELPLPHLPLIPGHEIVAVVDQLGDKVTSFSLGDQFGQAIPLWGTGGSRGGHDARAKAGKGRCASTGWRDRLHD